MIERLLLVMFSLASAAFIAVVPCHGQIAGGGSSEETFRKQMEASFKSFDRNEDGYLDKDELPQELRELLAVNNTNRNTRVTLQDYLQYRELTFQLQTAASFKSRDRNQDGFLDKEEMQPDLRDNLSKYGRGGGETRVTFEEYLRYRRDRYFPPAPPVSAVEPPTPKRVVMPPQIIVIDESSLEKRPTMYRAGHFPKGMPAWFEKLDADEDGQIAIWEWRKGAKAMKEFTAWDRNDDGLITIEELLYKLNQERLAAQRGGRAFSVGAGREFREVMEDGAASAYYVRLEKDKTYRIDMIASDPQMLDPYLYLLDQRGKVLARDDDGGGQLSARIVFKPEATGNFRIIAASVGNRGNGEYFLSVQEKLERAPVPSARGTPP